MEYIKKLITLPKSNHAGQPRGIQRFVTPHVLRQSIVTHVDQAEDVSAQSMNSSGTRTQAPSGSTPMIWIAANLARWANWIRRESEIHQWGASLIHDPIPLHRSEAY